MEKLAAEEAKESGRSGVDSETPIRFPRIVPNCTADDQCFEAPYKELLKAINPARLDGLLGHFLDLLTVSDDGVGIRYTGATATTLIDRAIAAAADSASAMELMYSCYSLPEDVRTVAEQRASTPGFSWQGYGAAVFPAGGGRRYVVGVLPSSDPRARGSGEHRGIGALRKYRRLKAFGAVTEDGIPVNAWNVDVYGKGSLVAVVNGTLTSWVNGVLQDNGEVPALMTSGWTCSSREPSRVSCTRLTHDPALVSRHCSTGHVDLRGHGTTAWTSWYGTAPTDDRMSWPPDLELDPTDPMATEEAAAMSERRKSRAAASAYE